MTVSNELMLAILAMDSYNRGYGAGIGDGLAGSSYIEGVANSRTKRPSTVISRTKGW